MTTRAPSKVKPDLLVRGRNLDDVATEALERLRTANDPPATFCGPAGVTRLQQLPTGELAMQELDAGALSLLIARAVECMFTDPKGHRVITDPPMRLVGAIASHDAPEFPPLVGISRSPLLRADGSVVAIDGYDSESRLWFSLDPNLSLPRLATHPTPRDVRKAAKVLTGELLSDFWWGDDGPSMANACGLVMTPVLRLLYDDIVPLHAVVSNQPGSGKGLLVQCCGTVATGRAITTSPFPASSDELRKLITSLMRTAPPVVCLDNVTGIVRSRELSRLLTSPVWGDRLLGVNRALSIPNRTTWGLTGNSVRFGGDLARRVVPVTLSSARHDPWNRDHFRHPDLKRWTAANRGLLLWSIFTLARAWIDAARPDGSTLYGGGFESWSSVIGGICDHAEIGGHLTNLSTVVDHDWEDQSWVLLLGLLLQSQSFAGIFTAPQLIEHSITSPTLQAALADVVPRDVTAKAVGEALGQRAERWHRLPDGRSVAVARAGTIHGGARAWTLKVTS